MTNFPEKVRGNIYKMAQARLQLPWISLRPANIVPELVELSLRYEDI